MALDPERRRGAVLRLGAAVLLVVGFALVGPMPAAAEEATAAEAAALARAAVGSDAALAELRSITEVDGRPVDLAAATARLGDAREVRLLALAAVLAEGGSSATPADPDAARQQAEEVLNADKFNEQQLPRPFRGVLEWLADRLRPVGRFFSPVGDLMAAIPGGPYLLGAVLAAVTGWLIVRLARRRAGSTGPTNDEHWLVDPGVEPEALDAQAEAAEADGLLDAAVRLRYQAGLLRLAGAGQVVLHRDTTPSEVAATLGDRELDAMTRAFEEIVYGDRPATLDDVARAKAGWAHVLGAAVGR